MEQDHSQGVLTFGTEPRKLVRRADPDTSQEAAAGVNATRLEEMVYAAIVQFGVLGCISDELRALYAPYPYSSITARYKALMEKGLIFDTGERRPGVSGRRQRVLCAMKFRHERFAREQRIQQMMTA